MTNIILKSPVVTEKATALAQKNVYAFIVSLLATKDQIRNAVESYYGVKVGRHPNNYSKRKGPTCWKTHGTQTCRKQENRLYYRYKRLNKFISESIS